MSRHSDPQVEHIPQLAGSKAMALVLSGWASLIEQGLQPPGYWLNWDAEVLVICRGGGTPVAALCFGESPSTREIVIGLGYVLPGWRRAGLYSALWLSLVEIAHIRRFPVIRSETSMANAPMLRFARKMGRVESRAVLTYDVPANGVLIRGEPISTRPTPVIIDADVSDAR